MSFYGIMYQIADTFKKIKISNKGKNYNDFPETVNDDIIMEAESLSDQIDLTSGNTWINLKATDREISISHNEPSKDELTTIETVKINEDTFSDRENIKEIQPGQILTSQSVEYDKAGHISSAENIKYKLPNTWADYSNYETYQKESLEVVKSYLYSVGNSKSVLYNDRADNFYCVYNNVNTYMALFNRNSLNNNFIATKSENGYPIVYLDCSTFLSLITKGIEYKDSPYYKLYTGQVEWSLEPDSDLWKSCLENPKYDWTYDFLNNTQTSDMASLLESVGFPLQLLGTKVGSNINYDASKIADLKTGDILFFRQEDETNSGFYKGIIHCGYYLKTLDELDNSDLGQGSYPVQAIDGSTGKKVNENECTRGYIVEVSGHVPDDISDGIPTYDISTYSALRIVPLEDWLIRLSGDKNAQTYSCRPVSNWLISNKRRVEQGMEYRLFNYTHWTGASQHASKMLLDLTNSHLKVRSIGCAGMSIDKYYDLDNIQNGIYRVHTVTDIDYFAKKYGFNPSSISSGFTLIQLGGNYNREANEVPDVYAIQIVLENYNYFDNPIIYTRRKTTKYWKNFIQETPCIEKNLLNKIDPFYGGSKDIIKFKDGVGLDYSRTNVSDTYFSVNLNESLKEGKTYILSFEADWPGDQSFKFNIELYGADEKLVSNYSLVKGINRIIFTVTEGNLKNAYNTARLFFDDVQGSRPIIENKNDIPLLYNFKIYKELLTNDENKFLNKSYPTLSIRQRLEIKNLMDDYFKASRPSEEYFDKFIYDYDTLPNSYATTRCWDKTNKRYRMCCSTFCEQVWMGRSPDSFPIMVNDENEIIDHGRYSPTFTPVFNWGYHFTFDRRKALAGYAVRVDSEGNNVKEVHGDVSFGKITGFYDFQQPNKYSAVDPYKYAYSISTTYNSDKNRYYGDWNQFPVSFQMAHDIAYELYSKGYEIPFSELDIGDIIFTTSREPYETESDYYTLPRRWRSISHASLVYDKGPNGISLIECTPTFGKDDYTIIIDEFLPYETTSGPRQLDKLLKNVVFCARHPAAWGNFNMPEKFTIDYIPARHQDGVSTNTAIHLEKVKVTLENGETVDSFGGKYTEDGKNFNYNKIIIKDRYYYYNHILFKANKDYNLNQLENDDENNIGGIADFSVMLNELLETDGVTLDDNTST